MAENLSEEQVAELKQAFNEEEELSTPKRRLGHESHGVELLELINEVGKI